MAGWIVEQRSPRGTVDCCRPLELENHRQALSEDRHVDALVADSELVCSPCLHPTHLCTTRDSNIRAPSPSQSRHTSSRIRMNMADNPMTRRKPRRSRIGASKPNDRIRRDPIQPPRPHMATRRFPDPERCTSCHWCPDRSRRGCCYWEGYLSPGSDLPLAL